MIEIAPPDHDLVGIADVIERRDLTTRKLLAILMSQHQQPELRTVRAALGAQTVDAVQELVAHVRTFSSGTEHRRAKSFAPPSPAKKLWATSSLNSVLYFFMYPLEVCPTSGGQFKPRAIHLMHKQYVSERGVGLDYRFISMYLL